MTDDSHRRRRIVVGVVIALSLCAATLGVLLLVALDRIDGLTTDLGDQTARVDQLEGALTDAGVDIPPPSTAAPLVVIEGPAGRDGRDAPAGTPPTSTTSTAPPTTTTTTTAPTTTTTNGGVCPLLPVLC